MADAATTERPTRRPSEAALLWGQFRHQNLLLRRTPIAAFFSLGFPLMFLVLLLALSGNETVDTREGLRLAQFFTPSMMVFGIVSSTYTNLATSIPIARDEGILKKVLATPLPRWTYVLGRILSATWFALLGATLMTVVAVVLFNVHIYGRVLPGMLMTIIVGAVSMCAVGLAVGSLAPSGDSAPALANLTFLPIAFISGLFFPLDNAPQWVVTLGNIFPIKHFADIMQAVFDPRTEAPGLFWGDLAVIVVWGVLGAVVAVRRFSWQPRTPRPHGERSSRRRR
jgi:ABC-2 type transport system permease protein